MAKLAAVQLVEEDLVQKAEESWRRQRLDKAEWKYEEEKRRREMKKAKEKKRKADKEMESDDGSMKIKEVSKSCYIQKTY